MTGRHRASVAGCGPRAAFARAGAGIPDLGRAATLGHGINAEPEARRVRGIEQARPGEAERDQCDADGEQPDPHGVAVAHEWPHRQRRQDQAHGYAELAARTRSTRRKLVRLSCDCVAIWPRPADPARGLLRMRARSTRRTAARLSRHTRRRLARPDALKSESPSETPGLSFSGGSRAFRPSKPAMSARMPTSLSQVHLE